MSERILPLHLVSALDDPNRDTRLIGVGELAQLATSADLAVAAAARRALEQLTDDDSRSVAAAATTALGRTSLRLEPDRLDFGEIHPGTPHVIAEVAVAGPPLALANLTVTASGPGLRAAVRGHRMRILWQPASDWLDGSVTVRGPAGWAEIRVTGRVAATGPASPAAFEAQLEAEAGVGDLTASRVTVLSVPPARRRAGASVIIGALTALVLLGGAGVAVAMSANRDRDRAPVAAPAPSAAPATAAPAPSAAAPTPSTLAKVPLAAAATSVGKPAVVGTIRVGDEPEGVAVSPDGRTVYVANQNSRILSVVDAATRRVTPVRLRNTPRFVTTSRDGSLVFVSMYEKDMSGSGLAVVDAATRGVTPVRLRNTPRFVTTSRDGSLVFVSMYEKDMSGSGLAVVDAARRKVVRYLSTGVQPFTLAVGPDDRVWVPIHSRGRLEIFSAGGHHMDARVTVPANPHAVAFSAGLRRAYTANHESNAVAVIDMRTDRLVKSVPVSKSPHSVAVSPDGRTVLVAGYEADTADLIDAATLRRTGPFRVGDMPQSVAFAADGRHGYVVNEGDDTVSVVDARTGKVTSTVRVGGSPRTIAISPDGRRAYVTNGHDDTVSVLRTAA
jgi:YVTN family beta-propeller protein